MNSVYLVGGSVCKSLQVVDRPDGARILVLCCSDVLLRVVAANFFPISTGVWFSIGLGYSCTVAVLVRLVVF